MMQYKEIVEAIEAAKDALSSLERVETQLGSARNWGIWDMLGGGFISSMVKHSKLDAAQQEMEYAKSALRRLQRELMDVDNIPDVNIQVGDFMRLADVFFDGLIVDWLVQSKINEARSQVENAKQNVSQILNQLYRLQAETPGGQ